MKTSGANQAGKFSPAGEFVPEEPVNRRATQDGPARVGQDGILPYRLKINKELSLGLIIVCLFIVVALAAPRLAPPIKNPRLPVNYQSQAFRIAGDPKELFPQPPGPQALFGTTSGQQDIFYALVWGTRNALRFGLVVAICAAGIGVLVGAISGFFGGWLNWLLMRVTDGFLTFPLIAGVILSNSLRQVVLEKFSAGIDLEAQIAAGGVPGLPPLLEFLLSLEFVLILLTWMPYARLTNAMVIRLRSSEFVEAARALGAGNLRIMLRHLIPNSLSPALVLLSRDIGNVVLMQAALTFIRMDGGSVWGEILAAGKEWIIGLGGNPFLYWWVFLPASLVIVVYGIGWSLVGDGLNDLIHPRRRLT